MTRTEYHRIYYRANKARRRAQRLASKWKALRQWRDFLA